MFRVVIRRAIVSVMALSLMGPGFVPAARAGMIGTQTWLQMEQREARIARVDSLMLRQDVQRQLLALGVSPAEVHARLGALTDDELQALEGHLDSLPAGGEVLAVVGIVFVVLIILELVGVTNIFSKL